ncbi:MAG: Na/Pi cotransporter family protein [Bacteroidales bacterium]|jgi:phosphate:Na+ symporter|nr:Na/Pi cotransporter family protein [Bacteroidales bacterium]MBO7616869.1 Na/Pi cotransporter family protein [Bacteroidales bacterium]
MTITIAILTLLAGIGVFLVACQMMSAHLEAVSSKRLKQLFSKTGKNKWLGVGIGTVGTAAIQSSGAVTVMVIGFVNVGILSLAQAATIIYGANIGTTVTAQLVALGMFGTNSISTTVIFAAFAGVGAFMNLFSKRNTTKQIGGILTGFGLLFVGLSMMSDAMDDFAALDSVKRFLAGINNVVLLVLVGAVLTAIIQSSSVMTSIAITMVVSGLITLDQGIYLTMGSNIGSCVVAVIAGLTSGTSAKRTALIHLIFNVMGVVLFLLIGLLLRMTTGGDWSFGQLFERLFPAAPQLQLAMFHTVFNICTMLVAMPLTNALVNLACRIVSEPPVINDRVPHLRFLNEQMLRTPVIAIRQMKAEIENMAEQAILNFRRSIHIVTTMDFSMVEEFRKTEIQLNYLNKELVDYSVKLSGMRLNNFDQRYLSSTIRSVSDLERIGDYAENIVEYAEALKEQNATFSEEAVSEILKMEQLILALYKETMQAYHKLDLQALERANQIEEEIDDYTEQMERNHIDRLVKGVCTPSVGAEYLSLAQNSERIGDHLTNVGKTIRDLT